MLKLLAKLFGSKKPEQAEAPYKIETPVVDLADIAIAQRPDPVVEKASQAMVESVAPAKKKPAAKKSAAPKKSTPRKSKPKA
jgi:hypothetical protein